MKHIVLLAGFEVFNAGLYRQAAERAMAQCPGLAITVFSDRDLVATPEAVAKALSDADALFASLIFDFDQVEWLRQRAASIPTRLVFESAIELMELTRFGRFTISHGGTGMPRPIQALLARFGSGREEDNLAAYIGFLKVGPKLLRFLPLRRAQDLRHWLILYRYWNGGGSENITALFLYLARHGLGLKPATIPPQRESPDRGLCHPDHDGYFPTPHDYLAWFSQIRPQSTARRDNWPVVGLLLYRKHVITGQPYIAQLIRAFEAAHLVPLPVFINGVEGHIAVRDWMTSATEQGGASTIGKVEAGGSHRQAVAVDAIVSTIGFPLVGGPAGSMEAGRREEVAQRILRAKDVPYVVAAPLLIQDLHSWTRQGIGGLQSVVLFALPELDGAIDPVPLGGLVGDRIYLIPERLKRLTGRLNGWIALRRKPPAERRVAIVLYGFPPGYGATGTAALLHVPNSLMALLEAMAARGYGIGPLHASGEELIRQVKQADDTWVGRIPEGEGFEEWTGASVSVDMLRQWLGPLHTSRIETQWGPLGDTSIRTLAGRFLLGGVSLGNVWIGVQPPLGVAGDPMRLMYERDLTPHPQYAAFYGWLQHGFRADVVLHFGMHGTVEWLPGSPLGNTGYSWPDLLLGNLPHLYVYAANNPSESMLAKRRGYGVIISHNVPPYGRAGLYRELIALRDLIAEYRQDPTRNAPLSEGILKQVSDSGLDADCPAPENARADQEAFDAWVVRLAAYLQVLESRLFSSGLHTLGRPPDAGQRLAYLRAYVGPALPDNLLETISRLTPARDEPGLRAQAAELERRYPAAIGPGGPSVPAKGQGEGADGSHGTPSEPSRRPISPFIGEANERSPSPSGLSEPRGDALGEAPGEARGAEFCRLLLDALRVCQLLERNTEELDHLLDGLDGRYIPPAPGGDLLRDGPGVLPTGRNIHALDPYRMPSPGALARGRAIALRILEKHRTENAGAWPETVAVMLWGLDAIKTRGESLAILLELVGAEVVKEGTGRIVRYELRPLESLEHPRIDVLVNLSGIFRDSFVNIVELLDDLFRRAAEVDELDPHLLAEAARGHRRHGRAGGGGLVPSPDRGRYVKPLLPKGPIHHIAIDATLRAAAPHQRARRRALSQGLRRGPRRRPKLLLHEDDLRVKLLLRKAGALVIFVVDASGSMAQNRMQAAKGAALQLLAEAYRSRDQVALITCRGRRAELQLPPTRSITAASRRLARLPCGGGSPLAHGLALAVRVGENARRAKEVGEVLIVLISDGKANVSLHQSLTSPPDNGSERAVLAEIRQEVLAVATAIRRLGMELLVIDTGRSHRASGLPAELARQGGGRHESLPATTPQAIGATTRRRLGRDGVMRIGHEAR